MNRINRLDSSQRREIILDIASELIRQSFRGQKNEMPSANKASQAAFPKSRGFSGAMRIPHNSMEKSIISSRGTLAESQGLSQGPASGSGIRPMAFPRRNNPRVVEYVNPLVIPHVQLPPRFQYLKPTPTRINIDLGKINPLVKDPLVGEIECQGANQKIIVSGTMGRRKTDISLTRDEIEETIGRFSEVSKIPVQEGVFKVVVGSFIFSAVVSNLITSRFIIKKMNYNPNFRR
jgi:hypothetical protein